MNKVLFQFEHANLKVRVLMPRPNVRFPKYTEYKYQVHFEGKWRAGINLISLNELNLQELKDKWVDHLYETEKHRRANRGLKYQLP